MATMAPRPGVLRPALHKWGLVRVSTHWYQTGRLGLGGGRVLWGIPGSERTKLELEGRKGRMSARNKKVPFSQSESSWSFQGISLNYGSPNKWGFTLSSVL